MTNRLMQMDLLQYSLPADLICFTLCYLSMMPFILIAFEH
jgi:hypothetical protein